MIARGLSLAARIKSHPFVRQISGMMLLTAVGQGLYVLAGPFIGRLYSPEQIGLFGLFVTMWMVLALFAGGLYDLAIPGARDDDEARMLGGASVAMGIGIGVLSGGGLSLASANGWFGLDILPIWAGIPMFSGMVAQTIVLIGQAWAVRRNEVMTIGRASVMMNGLRSLLQILGGLLAPFWVMMAAGEIVARVVQGRMMGKDNANPAARLIAWNGARAAIVSHRRFPIVFAPAFGLDGIAILLQTAMMGYLFGAAEMGQFFLMRRTLDLPVAFAFRSLSDLFFARQLIMAREAPHRLRPFFLRSGALLAIVGALGGAPLFFWGPELFRLFYGSNWGVAGALAAIMLPAMIINLAVAPVSRVFQITTKSYLRLLPGLVNVAGSLFVLWLANRFSLSLVETTIGVSLTIGLHYVVYFAAGYFVAGHVTPTEIAAGQTAG